MSARSLAILLACFLASALPPPAAAQNAPSAPAVDLTDSAKAKAALDHMDEYLAKAQGFSVTIETAYDVVQPSGQRIEFGELRRVLLTRPDKLRIELERRDGTKQLVLFDGKSMTMFSPKENVFATLVKPGTVDQVIYYLINDLQTPIPLAAMLLTTLKEELDRRITDIALVDDETIGGRTVDHVAARAKDVDFQIWIARGDQPVPMRVVITYKKAAGQPQFSAMLSDWNFSPKSDASTFVFAPPAGASPVVFMVPAAAKAAPSGKRK